MQSYAINKVGTQSFAGFGDDGNHSDARTIDDQVQYRADEVQRTHRGHLWEAKRKHCLWQAGKVQLISTSPKTLRRERGRE